MRVSQSEVAPSKSHQTRYCRGKKGISSRNVHAGDSTLRRRPLNVSRRMVVANKRFHSEPRSAGSMSEIGDVTSTEKRRDGVQSHPRRARTSSQIPRSEERRVG